MMTARIARLACCIAAPLLLCAQTSPPQAPVISDERILGVIPNFQTVNDPATPYTPLRARDKWKLFVKETLDPYTFFSSAAGAASSQLRNGDPKYGQGGEAYLGRFGAAQADVAAQNFFSDAVLASLLHEDPRYFRKGPEHSVLRRIGYATSRVVITRNDAGRNTFNFSGILGMGLGIVLSNAYYPPTSVNADEMGERTATSLSAMALGNLLPEFWPDVKAKLDRLRRR